VLDTITANRMDPATSAPCLPGPGTGVNPLPCPWTGHHVWDWGSISAPSPREGVDARVSSWTASPQHPSRDGQDLGQLHDSQLIKMEAIKDATGGYRPRHRGKPSEGSGENIFVVKKGPYHAPLVSRCCPGSLATASSPWPGGKISVPRNAAP